MLTERGQAAIVDPAPDHVASVRRHFIDRLSADEIDTLASLSHRIVDHLQEVELNH